MGKEQQQDLWRDSLVRYLGYANELGESFRPIVPGLVVPSYLVAFGYVLGDTLDKAGKAHAKAVADGLSARKKTAVVADATFDTLAWQTMASVVIPGFTINRVVRSENKRKLGVQLVLTHVVGFCCTTSGGYELVCRSTRGEKLAGGASLGPDGHRPGRHPAHHPPDRQRRGRRHGLDGAPVVQEVPRGH